MTDRAPSARLTAEVYLWAPSEFPQDLDDQITLAFEQAEELLKERLHELDAIREVRCDF